MARDYAFPCPLPNGLHARPASHFVEAAGRFACELSLLNERTGVSADAKSILAVISIDVRLSDPCRTRAVGIDEDAAITAVQQFIEQVLPGCDEPLPVVEAPAGAVILPRELRSAKARWLPGTAVSRGIGRGAVVSIGGLALPEELASAAVESAEAERQKVTRAAAAVRDALQERLAGGVPEIEGAILRAHQAIAADVALEAKLVEFVDAGQGAAQAIVAAARFFADRLLRAESVYVRERAADVKDVCLQLLQEVCGPLDQLTTVRLTRPTVVVADYLTPSQFLALDRRWLRGLVLGYTGTTSHTVILARSFQVPTLVGVDEAGLHFPPGSDVVVDANVGILVPSASPVVQRFYDRQLDTLRRRQERLAQYLLTPAGTRDGRRLEIGANVATAEELEPAFQSGADGIGLFRTEMLFLDRDAPPTEEEQFAVYVQAAKAAGGRPVIIRTIDIGGDKPARYLDLPIEANPFLGYRGVRIYREYEQLFRDQVRAILRASAFGRLWLMVPMVASLDEVRWVKERIAEVRTELQVQGVQFDPMLPVGIMIEIPSVAFVLDQLCSEVDFFSIGTNDLTQYFFAVDRDNRAVAELFDPRSPAMLRLLSMIVTEAHRGGRWVGLCGEMGREMLNLPLLIGLGLDEVSMAAPDVPALKAAVSRLSTVDCRQVLDAAMKARTAAEVGTLLRDFHNRMCARPLLERELICLDSDSRSKEEAIREAIDALYVTGRTDDPQQIEEAVWAREAVGSTDLGFGFATPHCKTNALTANSIAVVRLREPADWGSTNEQPVQMVILLAIRESDQDGTHMRVLAQLARRLMHEDFRARVLAAPDRDAVAEYLTAELGLAQADARCR